MKKTKLKREIAEAKENFRRTARAMSFPEKVVAAFRMKEQENLIKKAKQKVMENLIESNPKIMFGKPVIKGTRITVELILEKFAAGESVESILLQHPHLTKEKVSSAVGFALESLRRDFPPRSENRKLLDALNTAYANDTDEEEKEFLRLMKTKQAQILDEWK